MRFLTFVTDEAATTRFTRGADVRTMTQRDTSKEPDWDQEDILEKKDHVTKSGRGLQVWDDTEGAPGVAGNKGTGSEGTAERAARIASAQEADAADESREA